MVAVHGACRPGCDTLRCDTLHQVGRMAADSIRVPAICLAALQSELAL
jgi:hypothetical protein